MQPTPYPASAPSPQETVAFCHWLLADERPEDERELDARDGYAHWHRLLRDEADDGFSHLLRAVRREAALLAERSAPLWDEVGRANPLARAAARAAARLAALTAAAPPGSPTGDALGRSGHLPV